MCDYKVSEVNRRHYAKKPLQGPLSWNSWYEFDGRELVPEEVDEQDVFVGLFSH
jgi:hypothetical protein